VRVCQKWVQVLGTPLSVWVGDSNQNFKNSRMGRHFCRPIFFGGRKDPTFAKISDKPIMKTQTWEDYLQLFEQILSGEFTNELYEKADYKDYVRMNLSRVNRWLKNGDMNADLVQAIEQINTPQTWFLITEPWCGDAAHSTPFIARFAALNRNITLKIVLRDENHDFIDQYLTNGGRSIPKLIIRDESDKDLCVWGPRPQTLSVIFAQLKAENQPFEVVNKTLQNWYNQNKGVDIQNELLALVRKDLLVS
jgi:hypothetical protein